MPLKSDNPVRGFFFDMDGVLVGSEREFYRFREHMDAIVGAEVAAQMSKEVLVGKNVYGLYTYAKELGATISEEEYYTWMAKIGREVYGIAPLSEGVVELLDTLQRLGYRIGLVSSSPQVWIDACLERLGYGDRFEVVVSVDHHPTCAPKPAPDGYLLAMEQLGVSPENAIVLEDSNPGIEAGKLSGAVVIGYTPHLLPDYVQEGADMYLDSMEEVARWVEYIAGL